MTNVVKVFVTSFKPRSLVEAQIRIEVCAALVILNERERFRSPHQFRPNNRQRQRDTALCVTNQPKNGLVSLDADFAVEWSVSVRIGAH